MHAHTYHIIPFFSLCTHQNTYIYILKCILYACIILLCLNKYEYHILCKIFNISYFIRALYKKINKIIQSQNFLFYNLLLPPVVAAASSILPASTTTPVLTM